MGWRRGEIWFDTETVWFRERSDAFAASLAFHAPTFFGLTPAPAAVPIPNGLSASRRRRAEVRRRRHARKTKTAALVLGPAVMLTIATPRLRGGPSTGALREDPPSESFRLPERPDESIAIDALTTSRATVSKPVPRYPAVHWQPGTSQGLPWSGSLAGGTQLPVDGRDWVTWNPVTDSVPNRVWRLYGNEHTIHTVISVIEAYRKAHPDAPRVVVGDISFKGGGPMDEHVSHQNGLDVDVYYPRLDRTLRAPTATSQIDRALAQDLLDRFVSAGAQMIFVGFSTGLRGPSGVVIPYPNHENHMHVRFPPPSA
jgi:murein endopeptidase